MLCVLFEVEFDYICFYSLFRVGCHRISIVAIVTIVNVPQLYFLVQQVFRYGLLFKKVLSFTDRRYQVNYRWKMVLYPCQSRIGETKINAKCLSTAATVAAYCH